MIFAHHQVFTFGFLGFLLFASVRTSAQSEKRNGSENMVMPVATLLKSEFVFSDAPFLQCHASTIVSLDNKELMASWFGGTHERHEDVSIYESHTSSGNWSKPVKIADGVVNDSVRYPTWNPVLFQNDKGTLFLFYKVGPSPSTWWGLYKTSSDNGTSWSQEEKLPDGILGPIKNKPIQLESGRILSPSSIETQNGDIWKAHIEISDDGGYSWKRSDIPANSNVKIIQPTLIQLPNSNIKALLRSDQNVLMESNSTADGITWSKAVTSTVKNPNSGIDALTLANDGHLLVYNPTLSGKDWSDGRQKLNLAYSTDGSHWEDILKLEDEEEGEFSYPAIIQDHSGKIHITYTYNREKVKHVVLTLNN